MAFYFKQQARLIERLELWPDRIIHRYWPERLSQINQDPGMDPPFRNLQPAAFFSKAIATISKYNLNSEILHGAVHGYTSALVQKSFEGSITSCTEGIERLLEIFERSKDLTRLVLTEDEFKVYKKATKGWVGELSFLKGRRSDVKLRRSHIQRHLKNKPTLTLQDRIERMGLYFSNVLHPHEQRLFTGIDRLIKVRNNIVHGKIEKNGKLLHAESVRGQALFEKLFLCLVGCASLEISQQGTLLLDAYDKEYGH